MSDNYVWRGGSPSSDPTLSWNRTFHQRKSHLASEWDNSNRFRRKGLIENVLYYSAITEVKEL